MKKFRITLRVFFLSSLLAMNVVAQKSRAAANDYFPLRVGDSWTYQNDEGDFKFTVTVLSAEKQADGTMRYLLEKAAGTQIRSWYSKIDGWVLMHEESYVGQEGVQAKYEPARQFLMNPLLAGAKWNWKGKSVTLSDVIESNQVSGPEVVKVPAGTFKAMKIVSNVSDGDATMTKTYWYASGVGLIKSMSEGRGIKYGWELIDYSFKNPKPKR